MIKPSSLQSTFVLVWSLDPSLSLPEHIDDPALDEAANASARKENDKERERLLRIARQTGNWAAVTKPGEVPTFFSFGHLSHNETSWLDGEVQRRQLGGLEATNLVFLTALHKIENFGDIKVERRRVAHIDGTKEHIWQASPAVLDKLHAALNNIEDGVQLLIAEFVVEINRRARGQLDPL